MVCWTTARCFSKDGSKTLCRPPIDRLSVLRLDGDMYESAVQALDTLYDKVSPGGFGRVAKLVEMATAVISDGQVTGSSGQIK